MSKVNYKKMRTQDSENIIVGPPDKALLIIVAFLVVVGVMAVFSAGAPKCVAAGTNPASFAIKQLVAIFIGYFVLFFFMNFDYKQLPKMAVGFSYFVIFLLFLVVFTPLGETVYGATRWINLGPINVQPSEFAKPAVVLLLANAFYTDAKLFVWDKFTKYFLPIIIMILLIHKQPNLSMILIILTICGAMYFLAGVSIKFVVTSIISAVVGAGVFLTTIIKPYQLSRIKVWLNPEIDPLGNGYNIIQSLIAFAVGGWVGTGFGASKQKLAWLPEAHTDFIFAVIAEEMGFIGCIALILLFIAFIMRGFLIAGRCTNFYGKLVAFGITFAIGIQAFINMAVASSLIPATGVTMPFISYGGSSIVVLLAMVGVLLNISRKRIKKIKIYE